MFFALGFMLVLFIIFLSCRRTKARKTMQLTRGFASRLDVRCKKQSGIVGIVVVDTSVCLLIFVISPSVQVSLLLDLSF